MGRVGIVFRGKANPVQQVLATFAGFIGRDAIDPDRTLDDIFQNGSMGEQVKALEDHANASTDLPDAL
ncbi:hypothetical protein D9M71_718390 [compost metagenome]